MNIQQYSKALIPLGVALVLALLSQFGIAGTMSLQDFISLVITSGLVFIVPNKKA